MNKSGMDFIKRSSDGFRVAEKRLKEIVALLPESMKEFCPLHGFSDSEVQERAMRCGTESVAFDSEGRAESEAIAIASLQIDYINYVCLLQRFIENLEAS